MRILFLESYPVWIHGLPNGFKDLGHEVRISGALTQKNIPIIISSFKPELIISMGWTNETSGKKLDWIRKHVKNANIPHIYWATEDPTHTSRFTLPLIKRMKPDFVFTICQARVAEYKDIGIKAAHLDFGFHPKVNYYTTPQEKYICNIAVVANGYPKVLKLFPNHYRLKSIKTLITPLIQKEDIRIDFWGSGWNEMKEYFGKEIPKDWIHGELNYTETNKVYSAASIVLGLQNHETQLTQRTYEVLGSKGFLLTSDTPAIRKLFIPNRDLVVSSSPNETLKLVEYYLKNKEEREKIRSQGQDTVQSHSYSNRAEYILKLLYEQKIII